MTSFELHPLSIQLLTSSVGMLWSLVTTVHVAVDGQWTCDSLCCSRCSSVNTRGDGTLEFSPLWDHKRYWVQTSNSIVCRWNSCWPSAIELDLRGLLMACQVGSAVVLRKQKKKKLNLFSVGNFPFFWVHFPFAIIVLLLLLCCTDKYIVGSGMPVSFYWIMSLRVWVPTCWFYWLVRGCTQNKLIFSLKEPLWFTHHQYFLNIGQPPRPIPPKYNINMLCWWTFWKKLEAEWTGTQLIVESQICTIADVHYLIKPVVALEDVEG